MLKIWSNTPTCLASCLKYSSQTHTLPFPLACPVRRTGTCLLAEQGYQNINSWLLFCQYAACFGVELTVNNTAASYFKDEFGLSTSIAGIVASLFGLMNLFARSLGGMWSGKYFFLCSLYP